MKNISRNPVLLQVRMFDYRDGKMYFKNGNRITASMLGTQIKEMVWAWHNGINDIGWIKQIDGDKGNNYIENLRAIRTIPICARFKYVDGKLRGSSSYIDNDGATRLKVGNIYQLQRELVWEWHNDAIGIIMPIENIDGDVTNDRIENLRQLSFL
jgi:hypothetical protein